MRGAAPALAAAAGPGAGECPPAPGGFEAARAVADAVLYEGYLLYPYRRSSGKNNAIMRIMPNLPPG